jgi:hypothetical protein
MSMKAAQQMHCIGHIAAGMASGSLQKRGEMGMARGSLARNSSELHRGNADRFLFE